MLYSKSGFGESDVSSRDVVGNCFPAIRADEFESRPGPQQQHCGFRHDARVISKRWASPEQRTWKVELSIGVDRKLEE